MQSLLEEKIILINFSYQAVKFNSIALPMFGTKNQIRIFTSVEHNSASHFELLLATVHESLLAIKHLCVMNCFCDAAVIKCCNDA
jgi:hypothetical protein